MSEVLYTTRWNDLTRRPVAGHGWLTPDEARRRYTDEALGLEIVDASARDEEGTPRPLWVIGAYGRFRVQLFTPGGAVARSVDWDLVDGRLWRWVTVEYVYPDDHTPYLESHATLELTTTARPDGAASFSVRDEASGETHVTQFADVATDGYWLDVPVFGEWGPIVNATLGATPGAPS
ncbi:hypothetical protein [Cellulomonas sp. S1-8]|uniref:hypothetical protein n=1 Tax=Cellulomonas sp. S1-8 TaxID=2904790 RepID=UPI0022438CC4|nr:hypothetical protein [Cellulomonas sp. S1-8]UZN03053.1 hypothetical protein OKX07_18685 [Cellulomonas sp. S1-8]